MVVTGRYPIPARMWLPLYILEKGGPIHAKIRFQKLVFLIQYAAHRDVYDFHKHHYGPYSAELNLDTTHHQSLISWQVNQSYYNPSKRYYSFEITAEGSKELKHLTKNVDDETILKIDSAFGRYQKIRTGDLLDEVYKGFALKDEDSVRLENKTKTELKGTLLVMTSLFASHRSRQSLFLAATLESVDRILSSLNTADTVRRGVVFRLADEIMHKCLAAAEDITAAPNPENLRPRFIEMAELEAYLTDYCDSRKISSLPLHPSLEDLISGEEAKRLQFALKQLPLPS